MGPSIAGCSIRKKGLAFREGRRYCAGVYTKVCKLRKWREEHGLRLVDVSDLTGLSIYKLSRLETGFTRFHPLDKVKIAQALGVRVRDLFPEDA
jgi:hypothetical protein